MSHSCAQECSKVNNNNKQSRIKSYIFIKFHTACSDYRANALRQGLTTLSARYAWIRCVCHRNAQMF